MHKHEYYAIKLYTIILYAFGLYDFHIHAQTYAPRVVISQTSALNSTYYYTPRSGSNVLEHTIKTHIVHQIHHHKLLRHTYTVFEQ